MSGVRNFSGHGKNNAWPAKHMQFFTDITGEANLNFAGICAPRYLQGRIRSLIERAEAGVPKAFKIYFPSTRYNIYNNTKVPNELHSFVSFSCRNTRLLFF